ncbi:MarR family transcriptional regulator [Ornithinimicrobium sp. F0845]|uniref:MarR family winged helix-turn-helix transcriptional regulator n=1 Tax=Ornithinimicrobium sp. F0845 TaxID=2926412 RepID=UPI001FF52B07|nr:MarR family transcriptional regulator [Ornithinimicrobium sp. F0845]MCK0113889.1 MarR family transcriptional regulator [Ornithinimicrobium sp. F0845]
MADRTTDEVDRIVAAWQRERPDLDVSPLEILSRVSRLARHLDLARRHAFDQWGLVAWEFDVLSALRRSGEPYELSAGELVRQTLVTSGTMTNRIDRLVSRGMVSRAHSTSDRRTVLISLTATGREAVDGALADLVADERSLLAGLSGRERDVLTDLLRRLVVPFEEG